MANNKSILFLYSEVAAYTVACVNALRQVYPHEIHIVGWDKKKKSNYKVTFSENVNYYPRSDFQTPRQLQDFCHHINPELIYVSGRMDNTYLIISKEYRRNGIPVVTGFDNQWQGTYRNYISAIFGYLLYRRYFSHIWVAGIEQYEYAKRLGFPKEKILLNVYSADVLRFNQVHQLSIPKRKEKYPKRLLYVGRFADAKGLDVLVEAYTSIQEKEKNGWSLTLVGNGPLKPYLIEKFSVHEEVEVVGFLQPDQLVEEIKSCGAFILPSRKEAWGVVIHEFCAAGFPVLTSNACGAATMFLKHGFNGYQFKSEDTADLKQQLIRVFNNSEETLLKMGGRSHTLAQTITTESWAATLLSVINYMPDSDS